MCLNFHRMICSLHMTNNKDDCATTTTPGCILSTKVEKWLSKIEMADPIASVKALISPAVTSGSQTVQLPINDLSISHFTPLQHQTSEEE